MTTSSNAMKYDEFLTQILVNEKSILGFLSTIFGFLARRTDFYYVSQKPYESMGFPAGVAEELVVKVLRTCDPKNWNPPNETTEPTDINHEIMCSTVAHEEEVIADEDIAENVEIETSESSDILDTQEKKPEPDVHECIAEQTEKLQIEAKEDKQNCSKSSSSMHVAPPFIPTQKNCDTYNGAERENYCWSQTILELEVTVNLPPNIKSSKDVKVTINPGDICISCRNGEVLIKDTLPFKIKALDSFWSISEGKLLIHLEKVQERWWTKLLNSEESIDLSKIDCSRHLDDLPDDHVAKIRELQFNQEQKMKGLPTTDQIRNMDILKKAWNADGSPFKGKEFDPSVLHHT